MTRTPALPRATSTEPVAVVRTVGLTKRYGHRTAVDAVDLLVRTGEVFGFLGPNGAGKTTTLRMRAVDDALAAVDLTGRGGDRFGRYSLGTKQRLGVAAALLKNPDLLILDEPTNGVVAAPGPRPAAGRQRRIADPRRHRERRPLPAPPGVLDLVGGTHAAVTPLCYRALFATASMLLWRLRELP